MDGTRIDHVGIATNSLDDYTQFWTALGFNQGTDELNEEQGVKIRFFESPHDSARIELLEPLESDTPIGRFIAKKGIGVQQVAVRVDDIYTTISLLKNIGVDMINDEPVVGAGGHKIAFVHPRSTGGVLVELLSTAD
tara:strand:+ start:174 stop:584 length:411 start_codon:yes stop_codon:yes gene_type:complete